MKGKTLRELLIESIAKNLSIILDKTYLSNQLLLSVDLKSCPQLMKGCRNFNYCERVEDRIQHWEEYHPEIRLTYVDCAWVLGGGLLKWQTFKSKYASELPEPLVLEGKKTWSITDLKKAIPKLDLTEIDTETTLIWQKLRQESAENAAKWHQDIPKLLNINPDECKIKKLNSIKPLDLHEKFSTWVSPLVAEVVPEYLSDSYGDAWEFAQDESNLRWMAKFGINNPIDLYGRQHFEPTDTWDDLCTPDETGQEIPFVSRDYDPRQIVEPMNEVIKSHQTKSIIVISNVDKNQLFDFCQLYELATQSTIIQIIATPDCNPKDLHELVLESCPIEYDSTFLPEELSRVRRFTWDMVDSITRWDDSICMIAIAHAENLTDKAVREIEDLRVRCQIAFLLGIRDSNLALEFLKSVNTPRRGLLLPPPHQIEGFTKDLQNLIEEGMPVDLAIDYMLVNY